MRDWINEHRNVFIGIIAGIVAVAVFSVASAVIIHKKNADKPTNPAISVNAEEKTGETGGETQSSTVESQSQIESSDITNITPSVSEKETDSKREPSTNSQTNPVPTGVKSLTDGSKKVYYPAALEAETKKYPVVVWANGTGCATDMYDGLLKKIAEGGYIVVADSSVMTADGKAQIDSIDYIIGKNSDTGSVFCGKVDTAKIGAAGHSQGGKSSVNAAQKDGRIKCIVSIAGASSKDEAKGLKASALYLTGTADMVVVSSQWCKPSYEVSDGRAVYASLKGGVHTTCMTNPEKVSGYAVSWFDAYLKNDSAAKAKFQNGGELSKDSAWQDFASKN